MSTPQPAVPRASGKTDFQVPSVQDICRVLSIAETERNKLNGLKPCFLPLLHCVRPDLYPLSSSTSDRPDTSSFSTIVTSPTPDRPCLIMLSGGVGSTCSLWRCLCTGRDFQVLFVQGLWSHDIEIEQKRQESVKCLAVQSRLSTGLPLVEDVQSTPTSQSTSCVSSLVHSVLYSLPASQLKPLNRKSRLALLTTAAYHFWKTFSRQRNISCTPLPCLVWGNVQEDRDVLEALSIYGFLHAVPFLDIERSLFAFCEAQNVSDVVRSKFKISDGVIAPSALLPDHVADVVCPCQAKTTTACSGTTTVSVSEEKLLFTQGCSSISPCSGCLRYDRAWRVLSHRVPCLSLLPGDYRCLNRIPTLRVEPKLRITFADYIRDKREGAERKRRGKQNKAVGSDDQGQNQQTSSGAGQAKQQCPPQSSATTLCGKRKKGKSSLTIADDLSLRNAIVAVDSLPIREGFAEDDPGLQELYPLSELVSDSDDDEDEESEDDDRDKTEALGNDLFANDDDAELPGDGVDPESELLAADDDDDRGQSLGADGMIEEEEELVPEADSTTFQSEEDGQDAQDSADDGEADLGGGLSDDEEDGHGRKRRKRHRIE